MNDHIFLLDECPKGLNSLQISADENAIFTFSSEYTDISVILNWVANLGCKFGDDAEMHFNFEKETLDIVLPLQIFKI
jgi:hypothetical protein